MHDSRGAMDTLKAKFRKIIEFTDRFLACGSREDVAFWLGYRHGIRHHLLDVGDAVSCEGHQRLIEVAEQGHAAKCHADQFILSYARGYRSGRDGRLPDEILGKIQET